MLLTYQRKSFTNSNGQIVHIEELPWEIGHHDYNIEEVFEGLSGDILELGCGSGNDAIWFAQKGFNVTAVDISSKEIKLAKQKSRASCDVREISNISFIVDDVHRFTTEDRFDIIYDRGFLHNTQQTLPILFLKLYHLLKDSGKIIILTGNPNHKASKGTLPTPMYIQTIEKNSENLFNIKLVKEIEFEQNVGYENSLGWLFVLEKK